MFRTSQWHFLLGLLWFSVSLIASQGRDESASQCASRIPSAALPSRIAEAYSAFDFDLLIAEIRQAHITSTLQLIRFLKQTPKYRAALTAFPMMPSSNGTHRSHVTPETPRFIVPLNNITFFAHTDPKLQPQLEVRVFDPNTGINQFHLIDFRFADSGHPRHSLFVQYDLLHFNFFTSNEITHEGLESCHICHGGETSKDPLAGKALFDLGPFYRNAFGRIDGELSPLEFARLSKWLDTQATSTDPLFRELVSPQWYRKANGRLFVTDLRNEQYGDHLAAQNLIRIGFLMRKSPDYSRLQYAIIAVLLGYDKDLSVFFDPTTFQEHKQRWVTIFSEKRHTGAISLLGPTIGDPIQDLLVENTAMSNRDYFSYIYAKGMRTDPIEFALKDQPPSRLFEYQQGRFSHRRNEEAIVARLRFLLIPSSTVPLEEWAVGISPLAKSYVWSSADTKLNSLLSVLGPQFLKDHPEFRVILGTNGWEPGQRNVNQAIQWLIEKSTTGK